MASGKWQPFCLGPDVLNSNHKNLSGHDICVKNSIILQFCTEHGSITAVLCAKFQNDQLKQMLWMNEI